MLNETENFCIAEAFMAHGGKLSRFAGRDTFTSVLVSRVCPDFPHRYRPLFPPPQKP